ncbi:TPA: ogr/Delta-like zinc finger family protein [Haemophilus influenzae]|uniref:ogr/Delta-like zinc finger family protein n=1 Tax=Haemophilus influenzae TaxID=727 RepID=UPI0009AF2B3F|nr:ogr/Delta-like zinc finger family protein [Haemophilus influenzae]MCK9677392.1 ogr/Delta-like zinc finger family protein [Haemophilus influenzae]MCK9683236.1 ogr/Delta-like zinc finger family protein [Haemophilus influenzae]RFN74768.1 transcriptional regulator [Haemophilus influenzae]RFN92891.1 transcriptional regulator [Haemophilus influenzae]
MIFCKICGYKAVINRSKREHKEYTKLYCTCKNKDCEHKFVLHLEFSHTTKPSKLEEKNYFKYIIANLPEDKKTRASFNVKRVTPLFCILLHNLPISA